jgi:protein-S-isoprenylcysteine O-methyltransferase Ste14
MDQETPSLISSEDKKAILKKAVIRFSLIFAIMLVVLLLTAGKFNWWEAWAYAAMSVIVLLSSRVYIMIKRPDMALERAEAGSKENVQAWDKALMPFLSLVLPLASWIVAGLDARFGWSPDLPDLTQWAALAVVFLGSLLGNWAMIANRFFSSHVRIQTDRGHVVVNEGPYRFVRHPGYAGGLISWAAAPVFFSSYWVAIPTGLAIIVVIIRTSLEDRFLQQELPGYSEYTQLVRFRLIPGIW